LEELWENFGFTGLVDGGVKSLLFPNHCHFTLYGLNANCGFFRRSWADSPYTYLNDNLNISLFNTLYDPNFILSLSSFNTKGEDLIFNKFKYKLFSANLDNRLGAYREARIIGINYHLIKSYSNPDLVYYMVTVSKRDRDPLIFLIKIEGVRLVKGVSYFFIDINETPNNFVKVGYAKLKPKQNIKYSGWNFEGNFPSLKKQAYCEYRHLDIKNCEDTVKNKSIIRNFKK